MCMKRLINEFRTDSKGPASHNKRLVQAQRTICESKWLAFSWKNKKNNNKKSTFYMYFVFICLWIVGWCGEVTEEVDFENKEDFFYKKTMQARSLFFNTFRIII